MKNNLLVFNMPRLQSFTHKAGVALLATVFFLIYSNQLTAQDGKALFQSNCASCHNPVKDATGPALQGALSRVPSQEWMYSWVKNSAAVIASGDKYANQIYNDWNKTAMTAFPSLSHEEIDAIFEYVEAYEVPGAAAPGADGAVVEKKDNTWLYATITVVLALMVWILARVNKTLKKVDNDQKGVPNKKDVPVFRNKIVVALSSIILLVLAGYWMVNGAILMGNQQNYMPEQPIFYSHKVHAGINQINCLYCHAGAEKSRQAMIPSTNVCMNCHKQISEYTGTEKLVTYEGHEVDGTAEIQKLYEYAGWDPEKKAYKRDKDGNIMAKPVEWVKIHNLPDHVYFSHAQHVAVGQVQCQSCHGPIQEMDEVHQFAPLSMGWCINCHRQTNVQFVDNDYYSIFQKYHDEIKAGKREGVTAAELGGTECQKCHY